MLTDVAIIDAGAMAASRCNEAEHPCGSFRPLRRSQRSRLPDVVIAVWIQKFFGYTASILRRKRPFVCLLAHIQALAAERQHSRGDALAERNGLRVERDSVRGQTDALSQARSSLTDLSSQLEARQRENSNLTTTINHGLQDTVDAGEYRRSIAGTHHAEVRPIFVTNQELIKV